MGAHGDICEHQGVFGSVWYYLVESIQKAIIMKLMVNALGINLSKNIIIMYSISGISINYTLRNMSNLGSDGN